MAYESGCVSAPRVNIFSNPDKKYANVAQGSTTEDNARVIRQSAVSSRGEKRGGGVGGGRRRNMRAKKRARAPRLCGGDLAVALILLKHGTERGALNIF